MNRIKVDLYSLRFMSQHDLNPIHDIRTDNFLYDSQIEHKIITLGLMGLIV